MTDMCSRRHLATSILAGSFLLVTGCGGVPTQAPSANEPEPGRMAIVYWVPNSNTLSDGSLYVRELDSATHVPSGTDRLIGMGSDFWPVETHRQSLEPAWQVVGATAQGTEALSVNTTGLIAARWTSATANRQVTAMAPDGTVAYGPAGDGVSAIAPNGSPSTYKLPPVKPGTVDGAPIKAPPGWGGAGSAAAILYGADAHLIVAEHNGVNARLVDVSANSGADLLSYSFVEGMASGPDGMLYVLAWDESLTTNPYVFLVVDPASWSIKRAVRTPINPHAGYSQVGTLTMEATSAGILLYVTYGSTGPGATPHSLLLELPYGANSTSVIPTTDTLGSRMQLGADGEVRFFGGPARDRVTAYDPVSGTLAQTSASGLFAPSGSYVVAVFA